MSVHSPRDAEEEPVEEGRGYGRTDARQHQLFPLFQEHLKGNPCWQVLGEVQEAACRYRLACQKAYQAIHETLVSNRDREQLKLSEEIAEPLTMSLLVNGWHKALGSHGIIFDYTPRSTAEGRWFLQLSAYGTGNEGTPESLKPISDAHQSLNTEIAEWEPLVALARAYNETGERIRAFQQLLNPDARLRKLILGGRCEECP